MNPVLVSLGLEDVYVIPRDDSHNKKDGNTSRNIKIKPLKTNLGVSRA